MRLMLDRMLGRLVSTLAYLWERPLLGPANAARTEMPAADAPPTRIGTAGVVVVALCLGLIAGSASYLRATMFNPIIHNYYAYGTGPWDGPLTTNLVFDADIPKMTGLMTNRWFEQHVLSNRHPLLSLWLFVPVKLLRSIGLDVVDAARVAIAIVSGLWAVLLFSLLRLWGARLLDAVIFAVLGMVSASAVFWFAVPESFPFSSLTIVVALILTLWPRGVEPAVRYTAATAIAFSTSVTNSLVGLIATARRLPTKEAWIVGTSAWFIVSMLWALTKLLFPAAVYFFPPQGDLDRFIFALTPARATQVLQVLLSHLVVMPKITILDYATLYRPEAANRMMSVQQSTLGSGGIAGAIATLAWLSLLILGLWATWHARLGLSVICVLFGVAQVSLFLVFGPEVFLYSLQILPLVIVIAAGVTFTRFRRVGLALALVVIVLGGANNLARFNDAAAIIRDFDVYARHYSRPGL